MMLRIGSKGFTLIEVMLAASVLALGALIVYQAFFIALDSFNYYSHYLDVVSFANGKIWLAQQKLEESADLSAIETSGEFSSDGRTYTWGLTNSLLEDEKNKAKLFKLFFELRWREGNKSAGIYREAYALQKKE